MLATASGLKCRIFLEETAGSKPWLDASLKIFLYKVKMVRSVFIHYNVIESEASSPALRYEQKKFEQQRIRRERGAHVI